MDATQNTPEEVRATLKAVGSNILELKKVFISTPPTEEIGENRHETTGYEYDFNKSYYQQNDDVYKLLGEILL